MFLFPSLYLLCINFRFLLCDYYEAYLKYLKYTVVYFMLMTTSVTYKNSTLLFSLPPPPSFYVFVVTIYSLPSWACTQTTVREQWGCYYYISINKLLYLCLFVKLLSVILLLALTLNWSGELNLYSGCHITILKYYKLTIYLPFTVCCTFSYFFMLLISILSFQFEEFLSELLVRQVQW